MREINKDKLLKDTLMASWSLNRMHNAKKGTNIYNNNALGKFNLGT